MDVLSFLGDTGSLLPYTSRTFQEQSLAPSDQGESAQEHDSLSPASQSYYVEQGSDTGSSISLLDNIEDSHLTENPLLGTSLYIDEAFHFNTDARTALQLQRQESFHCLLRPLEATQQSIASGHNLMPTLLTNAGLAHSQLAIPPVQSLQPDLQAKGYKRPSCQLQEESESKRMKRLLKNRQSAVQSRARKKEYINGLETKVKHLTEQVQTLKQQLDAVMQENFALRQQLGIPSQPASSSQDCGGQETQSTTLPTEVLMQTATISPPALLPGLVPDAQPGIQMLPLEQGGQYRVFCDSGIPLSEVWDKEASAAAWAALNASSKHWSMMNDLQHSNALTASLLQLSKDG